MSKNYDVIPADRELARQLVGLPFDQAVEEIAAHREQHSVMAGEHLSQQDEDLIVIALQQCNTPGVEDLVKKIQNNYYLVLTTFSQDRAAQMVKDKAAANGYRDDELAKAIARATDRTMPPIPHLPEIEGVEIIDDFRERCAIKAMQFWMAEDATDEGLDDQEVSRKAFAIADAMVRARDGEATEKLKISPREAWDRAQAKSTSDGLDT